MGLDTKSPRWLAGLLLSLEALALGLGTLRHGSP